MKKNTITVNELIKRLEILKHMGFENSEVYFRDDNDFDWSVVEIWDTDKDKKWVALG